jgi:hypothetical protein
MNGQQPTSDWVEKDVVQIEETLEEDEGSEDSNKAASDPYDESDTSVEMDVTEVEHHSDDGSL